MVSFMSSAVAPISIASVPSAISSPAPEPTIPTPSTRAVFLSTTSLVRPSGRSTVIARLNAPHGNFGTRTPPPVQWRPLGVPPFPLCLRLGQTRPRDLRIGEDDGGNRERLEHRLMALD